VEVVFDYIKDDGGSPIITYSIEMDSGSGFTEVSVAPLLSSPAIIRNLNITSGSLLNFRYRALNIY